MAEINHPVLRKRSLLKAVVFAVIMAIIVLVIAVLPAEYGIDFTGAGKFFGLNKLHLPLEPADTLASRGKIFPLLKMEEAGSEPGIKRPKEADNPPPEKPLVQREDSVLVTVPAGKGIEFKMNMLKYGKVKYEWTTDKGTLYVDFHGEVKQAEKTEEEYYESHTIAYSDNMVGTFLSPFEGRHGWYFKNKGSTPITVTIRIQGEYEL